MTIQNSLNLGKLTPDLSSGKTVVTSDFNVFGQLVVSPKIEVKTTFNGAFFYPWAETSKLSGRIDLWGDDVTKEHEFSFFRDTLCSNAKTGIAVYKANQTNTINAYISASGGDSYLCATGGWLGIGTATPFDRLHVNNGYIRSNSGLKLGPNANRVEYASAAPTSGSWLRGDIIHNTAPSAGGFAGWICTAAGSPGTWKTWGAISA